MTITSFVRRLFRFFELAHGHFRGPWDEITKTNRSESSTNDKDNHHQDAPKQQLSFGVSIKEKLLLSVKTKYAHFSADFHSFSNFFLKN